jgi:hypothetical protein
MAKLTRTMSAVLLLLASVTGCSDDTTTLPEPCKNCVLSMSPSQDVTIYEDAQGETSNSAGDGLFAGRTSVGNIHLHPPLVRRALIRFDLATEGIPAGSTIDSVFLTVTVTRSNVLTGRVPFSIHKVLAYWGEGFSRPLDEGGGGTAASEGDATWVHRFYPDKLWAEQGGDFVVSPSASTTANFLDERATWRNTTAMTADVQGWLDDPSANFGWIILGDEGTAGTTKRFGSRESLVVRGRPSLKIYYIVPD